MPPPRPFRAQGCHLERPSVARRPNPEARGARLGSEWWLRPRPARAGRTPPLLRGPRRTPRHRRTDRSALWRATGPRPGRAREKWGTERRETEDVALFALERR